MTVPRPTARETRVKSDRENINTQNSIIDSLIREVISIRNSFNSTKEVNRKNILYKRIVKFLIKMKEFIS